MRPGYALYIYRFAQLIAGRTSVLVVTMFFAVILSTQAQESVEEVALPPWSEPTLPSSEPAPSEPLPSSEQAFPSSPDPWSSSTKYTTASTTVVPAPVATGPYGGSYNVFPAGETVDSGEGRRFHYQLSLTVRGVWDDNIFIS